MQISKLSILVLSIILLVACSSEDDANNSNASPAEQTSEPTIDNPNKDIDYSNSDLEKIYFAGGCFWGVEAYFERIYGVAETSSGYANGDGTNPTYESVISGEDGFAETVEVIYDPDRVSLNELLAYFFEVIDPTLKNQQGNDIGVQYRTGVYYTEDEQQAVIAEAFRQEQANYDEEIVTENVPLENYYLAEEEHQDYLAKNPDGYCHIDLGVLDDIEIESDVYEPSK
ncbi:MAG TPA: peptide-methionine (S)-S-oxide reductase MsrA [Virgibacillus sp.]|nr:peptide-methionine (S)-S-oxide reductase MsrA [Virgibacillus sp.]